MKPLPDVAKQECREIHHGITIDDPFRWLESAPDSPQVHSFIKSQNEFTREFLFDSHIRDKYQSRLESIWNVPKYGCPERYRNRIFFAHNEGMSEHPTIYYKDINLETNAGSSSCSRHVDKEDDSPSTKPNILEDALPLFNGFLPESASLRQVAFSADGQYIAFSYNRGDGSDWVDVGFLYHPHCGTTDEPRTTKPAARLLSDEIVNIKHSSLSWYKDVGVFYNRYDDNFGSTTAKPAAEAMGVNKCQKLCFHRLIDAGKTSGERDDDIFSQRSRDETVGDVEMASLDRESSCDESSTILEDELARNSKTVVDLEIISFPSYPDWRVSCSVTECQTYLICFVRDRCRLENLLWIGKIDEILRPLLGDADAETADIVDVTSPSRSDRHAFFRFRFDDWTASFHFVTSRGNDLYFRSNLDAEFYSLIKFRLDDVGCDRNFFDNNNDESLKYRMNEAVSDESASSIVSKRGAFQRLIQETVVAECPGVLFESAVPFDDDKLILVYLENVVNRLEILSLTTGDVLLRRGHSSLALPLGSIHCIFGRRGSTTAYFLFVSFLLPSTVYEVSWNKDAGKGGNGGVLGAGNGESDKGSQVALTQLNRVSLRNFEADDYETNQVFYVSKDGERIPMFLTHRKGMALDGSHPTMLYGYGGFNLSIKPLFSPSRIVFLQHMNGVVAVPNLRGGGEFGRRWHEMGSGERKKNTVDDFIAAAEFLIENGYASSDRIIANGASNGGLTVSMAILREPRLFASAVLQVGVFDLLRFHLFTIGFCWITEYGDPEHPEDFQWLSRFSPYHRVVRIHNSFNPIPTATKAPTTELNVTNGPRLPPAVSFDASSFVTPENPHPSRQWFSSRDRPSTRNENCIEKEKSSAPEPAFLSSPPPPLLEDYFGCTPRSSACCSPFVDLLLINTTPMPTTPASVIVTSESFKATRSASQSIPDDDKAPRAPIDSSIDALLRRRLKSDPQRATLPILSHPTPQRSLFCSKMETSPLPPRNAAFSPSVNDPGKSVEENLCDKLGGECPAAREPCPDIHHGLKTDACGSEVTDESEALSLENFPSIMCLTSATDDRVVPMHSFKFVAALQALFAEARSVDLDGNDSADALSVGVPTAREAANVCRYASATSRSPVALLRVTESTGHGLGKGTEKAIAELVDIFSFIGRNVPLEWSD